MDKSENVKLLNAAFKKAQFDGKVNNQEDFGEKLGYPNKSYISELMNGSRSVSNKVLQKIEVVFGYTAKELATGSGGSATKSGEALTEEYIETLKEYNQDLKSQISELKARVSQLEAELNGFKGV